MILYTYWWFIGLITLIVLTVQDYRKKRKVNDAKNYVMLGVSISLISHVPSSILYKLTLTLLLIIYNVFFAKIFKNKDIGEADINTIQWVFYGLGLISPYVLLTFVIMFTLTTFIFIFLKNVVFKYKAPVQFYGVILLTFILTLLLRLFT